MKTPPTRVSVFASDDEDDIRGMKHGHIWWCEKMRIWRYEHLRMWWCSVEIVMRRLVEIPVRSSHAPPPMELFHPPSFSWKRNLSSSIRQRGAFTRNCLTRYWLKHLNRSVFFLSKNYVSMFVFIFAMVVILVILTMTKMMLCVDVSIRDPISRR